METHSSVNANQIELLRRQAADLKSLDMGNGGMLLQQVANSYGNEAAQFAQASCPIELQQARDEACAWLLNNVAWICHDAGKQIPAQAWWQQARVTSERTNNWSLTARILGQQARQHLALGDPAACVGMANYALENDKRRMLTPTEHAMLHALRARGLGEMGDATATTVAIGQADEYWHAEASHEDKHGRPWISHYDAAHHWGDTGSAWRSLASHGNRCVTQAAGNYEQAARRQSRHAKRSKVMNLCDLAMLEIREGDVERGLAIALEGLDLGRSVSSARLTDRYRDLYAAAGEHDSHSKAADVQAQIREIVTSA